MNEQPKSASPTSAAETGAPAIVPSHEILGSITSSISGPSTAQADPATSDELSNDSQTRLALKRAGEQALAEAMPENLLKAGEYHPELKSGPQQGTSLKSPDESDSASTVSENVDSDKVGSGIPPSGYNPLAESLDRVRVDSAGQPLTTNQGVPVGDNQNSLRAGLRGPTLMEDFILREKLTHFDHERIPERVVHARGSAAHGYFECHDDLSDLSMASLFSEAGKRTPVFVRFSTVAGERGSADTVRDVRGFAVKFYTDAGNWDLVGNNMPVFFIQDAMKFPDLVHALKPEPHHAMPQASSAHDTFWDFVSLMPESTHMLMWIMSDRAIPRSYRMMQGFGVHTFRLVNAAGESVFCKFHWIPIAGTHSLVWDEAVKISGADPDYHRRDLWESIEAGAYPEYELAVQVFTEAQAETWSFDILDPTKIVPEELVGLRPVGRMVLNRNPDNFFAETEQVAFCTAHIVPGIDFSNDPLLQGRIHSYIDTQLTRLGGPNFHEIPINGPLAEVHNNQRDGMHRQAIARGRVAYEPNSLGGGCPFQAGKTGFNSFPENQHPEQKVRGKPERFADHYTQARLFWDSQTPVEQHHIINAYRFELSRVQTQAIRVRVISLLANVHPALANGVASGLGIPVPPPQQAVKPPEPAPEVDTSSALSLFARPGDGKVRGRRVAVILTGGVEGASLRSVYKILTEAGAAPRFVGTRLGAFKAADGSLIHAETSVEAMPSALWDAMVLPAGSEAQTVLSKYGQVLEFIKDQYRHCKPILALSSDALLLETAGIPVDIAENESDYALVRVKAESAAENFAAATAAGIADFRVALARHRNYLRETDPPAV